MAGPFAYLSDDDLVAELTQYRAARRQMDLGGGLAVIAGEGRRKEFTKANPGTFYSTLRMLEAEFARRPSLNPQGGGSCGGALGLTFGRY